jgi:hypothetical protein
MSFYYIFSLSFSLDCGSNLDSSPVLSNYVLPGNSLSLLCMSVLCNIYIAVILCFSSILILALSKFYT